MSEEKQKKGLPWWMWALLVIVVVGLGLVAVTNLIEYFGGGDRPIDQVVDHVEGDMLDIGDGVATFFEKRGFVWRCEPQFLGEKAQ